MNQRMSRNAMCFLVQQGLCFYCEKPMLLTRASRKGDHGWTVDHFYPRCDRPRLKLIVLAHALCNHAKGSRQPTAEEVRRYEVMYGFPIGAPTRRSVGLIADVPRETSPKDQMAKRSLP